MNKQIKTMHKLKEKKLQNDKKFEEKKSEMRRVEDDFMQKKEVEKKRCIYAKMTRKFNKNLKKLSRYT